MPTLNEAAEVLTLRRALEQAAYEMSIRNWNHVSHDASATYRLVEAALRADHGPLVAAVEQMATVLGERHAETCQSILLDCDCKLGHRQRAALAAYHAALGGTDGPR